MSEPSFRHERKVEEDGRDDAAGHKKGFEALSSDVGDVCYRLVGAHGGVSGVPLQQPNDQQCEKHAFVRC